MQGRYRRGARRGAGSPADRGLPRSAVFVVSFALLGVTVSGNLAGEGRVGPTDALVAAKEVAALARAVATVALVDVCAYDAVVQDVAFRALAVRRVIGVAVGWACSLVAEHLAPVRVLGDGREALGADAAVVILTHWLALVLAVSPEAWVHGLHALAVHQVVPRVAVALEAALGVDTALRARTGHQLTIVHVLATVLVGSQLVARLAHARVAAGHVRVADAEMVAELVAGVLPRRGAGAPVGLQGGVGGAEAPRRPGAPVARALAAAALHAAVPGARRLPAPARLGLSGRRRALQLHSEGRDSGGATRRQRLEVRAAGPERGAVGDRDTGGRRGLHGQGPAGGCEVELAEEAVGLRGALLLLPGRLARCSGPGRRDCDAKRTAEKRRVAVEPRPPAVAGAVIARNPLETAQGPRVPWVAAAGRELQADPEALAVAAVATQ